MDKEQYLANRAKRESQGSTTEKLCGKCNTAFMNNELYVGDRLKRRFGAICDSCLNNSIPDDEMRERVREALST